MGGTERNHKFRILSFYALHSIKAIQMRSLLILVVLQLSFFAGVSQGQPKTHRWNRGGSNAPRLFVPLLGQIRRRWI